MDKITVACVQQQLHVYDTQEEYQEDVYRFMRLAKEKEAQVIVFPELSGMMLAYPFLPQMQRNLLKRVDEGGRKDASLLSRMIGRVAGSASDALGGAHQKLTNLLDQSSDKLRTAYIELFSNAAREFEMYIVAGSLYLRDSLSAETYHTVFVFSPDGEVLGQQNKINLHIEEAETCANGTDFKVFSTEFGRFGVLIGTDVLYPESARLIAFEGAEMIFSVAACPGELAFKKMRLGLQSAVQANQIYGLQSFLVGKNIWSQIYVDNYTGKSALAAPIELIKNQTGIIYEVGTAVGDGFVSSEWDLQALKELWATSETRLRQEMNMNVYKKLIPAIYAKGLTIEQSYHPTTVKPPAPEPEEEMEEVPRLVEEIVREPIPESEVETLAPSFIEMPALETQEEPEELETGEEETETYTLPPATEDETAEEEDYWSEGSESEEPKSEEPKEEGDD